MEAVHVPAVGIQVYGAQLCKQPLLELSSCQGIRAQPSYPFICGITLKPANFLKVGNPLVQQTRGQGQATVEGRQQMAWTISWGIDLDVVVALTDRHLWTLWTLELVLGVIPNEPPLVGESRAVLVRLASPTGQLRVISKRHHYLADGGGAS